MTRREKRFLPLVRIAITVLFLALPAIGFGQAGVLIPTQGGDKPDPSKLSLSEMTVDIKIDNQYSRVRVMQIFQNHTDMVQEGKYVFLIPTTAAISDFAVWDGDVRIPGVIMERRRADEIYEQLKWQSIDPGLAKQADEQGGATAFTVQITPIAAYGTKRLELEYTEALPVDSLQTRFSFPFKPSEYGTQTVDYLKINLDVTSQLPLSGFKVEGQIFNVNFDKQDDHEVIAHYENNGVNLGEDFAFNYGVNVPQSMLSFISYRAPEVVRAEELRDPTRVTPNPDGYFEAAAIFNEAHRQPGAPLNAKPRSVILMLDTSLSMQWEKLQKSFEAMELFLKSMTPADTFNVILFNDEINQFKSSPQKATTDNVEQALQFIRSAYMTGGTDISNALVAANKAANDLPKGERSIVMVTDGNSTLTTTQTKKIVDGFTKANTSASRVYVFGIGSDTNLNLLGELARASRGLFQWSRETDDIDFKLKTFFEKVGEQPIDGLSVSFSDASNFYQVYPDVGLTSYDGSEFAFIGRYKKPEGGTVTFSSTSQGKPIKLSEQVNLPELDATHDHLPRLWARQRVDALLRLIDLNGESPELINEIIALSKKYKFVTPYTSFLAAPRSLLRPRVIKPGDPVLRVRADKSIKSIVAVLPFGETKQMVYLADQDIWETRFLAPPEMQDGTYRARLILQDDRNRSYQEEKSFVIDSRPPQISAKLNQGTVRAGDELTITATADSDTRRIQARVFGAVPVDLRWSKQANASVGKLRIPEGLPSGAYTITLSAEDFAHNTSSLELQVQVLGR
ncbi:MAG TPA: VIT and VWA domain-containing protein [Blastocatellia bacterium]|nr:VIT and VWA domain-containing protein [Blastocatellia bacterium]